MYSVSRKYVYHLCLVNKCLLFFTIIFSKSTSHASIRPIRMSVTCSILICILGLKRIRTPSLFGLLPLWIIWPPQSCFHSSKRYLVKCVSCNIYIEQCWSLSHWKTCLGLHFESHLRYLFTKLCIRLLVVES